MKPEGGSESGEGELGRRYLTVLFADLSQSTELSELMETEHYAAMLAAVRQVYQETIPRYGGMVVRTQGDGLLALFGYPATRENDGRSAVAAALDLHDRVRDVKTPLPGHRVLALHSGIHTGLVLLRSGNMELGRLELLGPVPNVAARLSDAAAPHEVLVSEETLGPASRFFVTGPPRLLRVKGRADPLLVYSVGARRLPGQSAGAFRQQGALAFFGRDAELELLAKALEDATDGRMRSVGVAGAPGMGKTRLIEHFLGRALQGGAMVLRGYCGSELAAEPMQPFRHMVQALALDAVPNTPESFDALFGRLAEPQTLILFVDDWQWADDASHQVVVALRKRRQARLLVLLSTRVLPSAPGPALVADETITLPPLGRAEAVQLVAAWLPGADPFVAETICQQASGNPLYLEELCHSAARGSLELGVGSGQRGAGWLKRLVESRVQHLPPSQIEVVRLAAVIGNVIPAWLLEQLTGQPADGPMQLALAEQDFIFPGELAGTLRFKHGLTRDIIYESVGLEPRKALHLRIARALQEHSAAGSQDDALEALALHFDAGGDAVQSARYAELAGDRALSASALDRARRLYRLALVALERMPQSAELGLRWVNIVQNLARVGVFDPLGSELPLFVRALELAERHGDAATIAQTRYWLGYVNYGLGHARAAIAHFEAALAEARAARHDKLVVEVVAALGAAYCATARYGQALGLLEEAIAVKKLYRSSRHVNAGLAYALVCRAYLHGDRGRFDEAHGSFDEAIACIGGATHAIGSTLHGWRGAVLLWQGRWEEARLAAEESARIAEATRSLAQLSIARAIGAYAEWMLHRTPESLQTIADVTNWLKPRGSGLFRSLNHGWLAEGFSDQGRRREARSHAAQALRRRREGDPLGAPMAYRALARMAATERPARVSHYLAQAMRAARERGSAHEIAVTQLLGAQRAWQSGQADEAQALLAEAVGAFNTLQMPWHLQQAESLAALTRSKSPAPAWPA